MAKTLATLIKLAGQKVERVQKELALAQTHLTHVHQAQQKWLDDQARGDKVALEEMAHNNPQALRQAGLFRERVSKELSMLAQIEAAFKAKVAEIMSRLNAHYAEQKRYEILLEQHELAERKKHNKKVQAVLDEAAGNLKERRS